jgi:hypothetical protein
MRGTRGVGSAIAVVFIILILVAAINSYLVTTLPQQMSVLEFQHAIVVKDEFEQLQSNVLLESANPSTHSYIIAPIQLGSQGEPPFGNPAASTVFTDPASSNSARISTGQTVLGGLFDTLYNRYFPINTVVYEYGAVIQGGPANYSTMISPPLANAYRITGGYGLNLTMVQLVVQNFSIQSGTGVMGVATHLLNTFTYSSTTLTGPAQWFNITTPYPGAWASYFNSSALYSVVVSWPYIHACSTSSGELVCTVSVPLRLQAITITVDTVGLSLGSWSAGST